ncbi:TetR/AcrR family transcriptional regulator [Roseibium sp.]|uniref:TetR/AcrR family transcriptional regulator n=1 Tax=Roseibium sp. TaxID=1936156 RepID=UPI003A9816A8
MTEDFRPQADAPSKTRTRPQRRSIGAQRNPSSARAILDAAAEILREDGYRGFSIEKVAKRARAGKPTVYRWWPSKAALLLEVYLSQKAVDYPDTGNLEQDIVQFIQDVFRVWRETRTGEIFRSMIAEAQSDPDASKVLAGYAEDRRKTFGALIKRAQERGEADPDLSPETVADWVASWLWSHLLTNRLDDTEEQTRHAVRVLIRGILRPE